MKIHAKVGKRRSLPIVARAAEHLSNLDDGIIIDRAALGKAIGCSYMSIGSMLSRYRNGIEQYTYRPLERTSQASRCWYGNSKTVAWLKENGLPGGWKVDMEAVE